MGAFSRNKGKRGEREVAKALRELTGRIVERRVRQYGGDSDLVGLEPWAIEVKYCATQAPDLWWKQAIAQNESGKPLLIYRQPQKHHWRARCFLDDIWDGAELGLWVEMHLDQWVRAVGLYRAGGE